MVVHAVGKSIVQPGIDQDQTTFLGARADMALTIPLMGRDCR
jgi:hypothetical protein